MYNRRFDKYGSPTVLVHEFSVVDKDVILGKNVTIEPFCIIEAGVEIGDDVVVKPYNHVRQATADEILNAVKGQKKTGKRKK